MWLGGVAAPLMIEGQRKKTPVGGEPLEVREEAAEYRPAGKNARKDQNPETESESGPSTDCCFCARQPRQVVRTATREKGKPVLLSGILKKVYEAMMGRAPSAITEPLFSEQNFS